MYEKDLWEEYKYFRNKVISLILREKDLDFLNTIDKYRSRPKDAWQVLKEILPRTESDQPKKTIFDDWEKIAEEFNEYVIDSINDIVKDFSVPLPLVPASLECSFDFWAFRLADH